jgi:hypothetical protein
MRRWNSPIALYLFLVFVSGAVVGALGYRTYNPPSTRSATTQRLSTEEMHKQYLQEMQTRVGLSADQLEKLGTILDDTDKRFTSSRETHNQEVKTIREDHVAKVRAILTPEQLPKYEQLRAEREQRQKQNKR